MRKTNHLLCLKLGNYGKICTGAPMVLVTGPGAGQQQLMQSASAAQLAQQYAPAAVFPPPQLLQQQQQKGQAFGRIEVLIVS